MSFSSQSWGTWVAGVFFVVLWPTTVWVIWQHLEEPPQPTNNCIVARHPSGLVSFHPESPGACSKELAQHSTGCCQIVNRAMAQYATGVMK